MRKISIMLTLIFIIAYLILLSGRIFALEMESSRYKMQLNSLDSEEPSPDNHSLSDIIKQSDFDEFKLKGYVIKTTDSQPDFFTFSLTNTNINFDNPLSNKAITGNTKISINTGKVLGFQVNVLAEGPLQTIQGNSIDSAIDYSLSGRDKSTYHQLPTTISNNPQTTIIFKINISPDQPKGKYSSVVDFIALPSY